MPRKWEILCIYYTLYRYYTLRAYLICLEKVFRTAHHAFLKRRHPKNPYYFLFPRGKPKKGVSSWTITDEGLLYLGYMQVLLTLYAKIHFIDTWKPWNICF